MHGFSTATAVNVATPYGGGYLVGGALGMNVMPNLRAELEVSYASHPALGAGTPFATGAGSAYADGSFGTLYLLGNLWYDFDTGTSITPYIGGGIGAAVIMPNVTMDGTPVGYNTNAVALAGQLGAGVKFAIADNVSLDLSYRARGVANASLTPNGPPLGKFTGVNYIDQSVQVGLDIGF
jgi:opacity protein-like surface antigen